MRGEREFLVSSDMKLKDFKVKVRCVTCSSCGTDVQVDHSDFALVADGGVQSCYIRPNLMVNGVYLTENEASLGQLKVLPGSLIFLRVS